VRVAVLWNVMPFYLVEVLISASAGFSETTVHFYQTTRRHIPSLPGNLCKNMKSFLVRKFEGSNPLEKLKSCRKNNIRMDLKRNRAKACGLYSSCSREGSVRGSRERNYASLNSGGEGDARYFL